MDSGLAAPQRPGMTAEDRLIMSEETGGRIFFSNTGRTFGEEDELCVLSVGVDIGSSTSHLVFSRIVLERLDSRYVITERESFYQSDILLTPYAAEDTIDAAALGAFIERQYRDAKVDPDEIDAGALILTGVAVRRRNARAIGELFARQAGRMVAVSAGDSLESVMAAYGSGAAARSIRNGAPVMNVDVGGGTAKIAVCADGKVVDVTALDVGARLVVVDETRRIVRVEEAGRRFGAALGLKLEPGVVLADEDARALAASMADRLFEAMRGGSPRLGGANLLRLEPLHWRGKISDVSFSGGVSEYIYGGEAKSYGDLGLHLAAELRARLNNDLPLARPEARIRATVIGAAQYTLQVSGSTIFVSANGNAAAAERAGDRARIAARWRANRARRRRRSNQVGAQAARTRRRSKPGRTLRAVARFGDIPASRRFLPRDHRRIGSDPRPRSSDRAGGRQRRRRTDRNSFLRRDEARQPNRLD